ncbi:aminoglycoside phosphotransferase [Hirsutella rhossiliensis]|uniref:Aminoglycoside phosphotransferase n=1 Tax=Hirsutella rhossiliensis TaxID=111463 RepID=A0A9P8N0F0_9HYPO|nr:Aminoglycoside phosphotransferase [Hirsutella rhossiliensis]KAH0964327.1 Aminoglycoside phosphotransferase [Hirsutella rhossiliensis]
MCSTLELLDRGPITYESAANKEANILNQLPHVAATKALYRSLWDQRDVIAALAKHHLRLGHRDECVALPPCEWIRGRFNVCIPVKVTTAACTKQVMLRCPMSYKLAESQYPGTVDEKLSCEVATYAWMQENCSDIRIPHLYGFGFSDDRHYTHVEQRPFHVRLARRFQRHLYKLLGYSRLSLYTANPTSLRLPTAYMFIEHIGPEVGQMLSNTWGSAQNDDDRRQRLFRGMARIMLSLARVPHLQIGSFRFDPDGSVVLGNRPLTCSMIILENDGALRTMQQSQTYRSTEAFVADMLTLHDDYFLAKPNAVLDDADCHGQMAVQVILRALSHHFIRRDQRNGPFLLQPTDLHASNIFVDADWNVTCLVDLEWICALPAEMLAVPYWITGCGIDEIEGDRLDEFDKARQEFLHILEQEERSTSAEHGLSLSKIMQEMWDSNGVWFWFCIESVNASLCVVAQHICPRFSMHLSSDVETTISSFWSQDSAQIVEKKRADLETYEKELRQFFGKASCA